MPNSSHFELGDGSLSARLKLLEIVFRCVFCCAFMFLSMGGRGLNAAQVPLTDVVLAATSINQSNAVAGALFTRLAAVGGHSPYTYELVAGPGDSDNRRFVINGSRLEIGDVSLAAGTYLIRLRITDGGTVPATLEKAAVLAVVDNVPPDILGVSVPAGRIYPAGSDLTFNVRFSEPVAVVMVAGVPGLPVTLDLGGQVQADYLAGSGTSELLFRYRVVPGNLDGDGVEVGAALQLNGGAIVDLAVSPNPANLTLHGLAPTTGVLVDGIPLAITAVSAPADGTARAGDPLNFVVSLTKAATVSTASGVPKMPVLLQSSAPAFAEYLSGSGTNALTFRYTVHVSDFDGDGIELGAISSDGGQIVDGAGNILVGNLANVAPLAGVRVDGTLPAIAAISRLSPNPTRSATMRYRVTFTEPVTGVDAVDFVLTLTGPIAAAIGAVLPVDAATYEITIGDVTGSEGQLRLDLKAAGSGIADLHSNPIAGGFAGGEVYAIDQSAPTLSISGPSVPAADVGPVSFTVNYSGADVVSLAVGDVILNATGSATAAVVQLSGIGNQTRVVSLVGLAGAGTLRIAIRSGSASDSAGNLAPASAASAVVVVNQQPVVSSPIPDLNVLYKTPFTYAIAPGTFTDPDADQTLIYTASSLPAGVTFEPATRTFKGSVAQLGTSVISVTVSDGGSPARTTSTSFNLVAGKAPLTVSADSRFRRYGDLNPELTVTYAGFVGGEDFTSSGIAGVPTIATAAVSASPVGVYPIMVGPGTLFASHYSFIFENGFLTVGKAPLTIVAEDKSRMYQSQNPMLTYRFVGFVNRDAIDVVSGAPSLSTIANQISDVGSYPITVGLGSLVAQNYYFTSPQHGVLAVQPATLAIFLGGANKIYNGQPQGVTVATVPEGKRVRVYYDDALQVPSAVGAYRVVASADDTNFTGVARGTMVIAKAPQEISLSWSAVSIRAPIVLTATSNSGLPVSYSLISGNATLEGAVLTLLDSNPVSLRATQAGDQNYQPVWVERTLFATARLPQQIQVDAPIFIRADAEPFSLRAVASSGLPLTYLLVSGPATVDGQMLTLSGAPGVVTVRLIQQGDATYQPAPDVYVAFAVNGVRDDRIVNFASLSQLSAKQDRVILGFVVTGNGAGRVLLRGVGPSLASFGISARAPSPRIQLFRDQVQLAENTGWSSAAEPAVLAAAAARVGAFPLMAASDDAVLLQTLDPGSYSVHLSGEGGFALAEIYEADREPGNDQPRFSNFSVRATIDPGASSIMAGFVISGTTTQYVLIRGIGPSLAHFGLKDCVEDPVLRLFADATLISESDDWGTFTTQSRAQRNAEAEAGAFKLIDGSRDAALVIGLRPGAYTVSLSPKSSLDRGTALIEVYALP